MSLPLLCSLKVFDSHVQNVANWTSCITAQRVATSIPDGIDGHSARPCACAVHSDVCLMCLDCDDRELKVFECTSVSESMNLRVSGLGLGRELRCLLFVAVARRIVCG